MVCINCSSGNSTPKFKFNFTIFVNLWLDFNTYMEPPQVLASTKKKKKKKRCINHKVTLKHVVDLDGVECVPSILLFLFLFYRYHMNWTYSIGSMTMIVFLIIKLRFHFFNRYDSISTYNVRSINTLYHYIKIPLDFWVN